MALDALIFDLDGTLIDTNPSHVEAWVSALAGLGYRVPPDRVGREIGKGGDKVVPSILGEEAERRDGERLRDGQRREFLRIARSRRLEVFPKVPELLRALAGRGIRTALATSSNEDHLRGTLASAGIDLPALVDEVVTKDDADASKPAPDLVLAAAESLGLNPAQCAMVGDTVYDAEACVRAGVVCLGVLSGGSAESELLAAGARAVWRDTAHLLADLDEALSIASPGAGRLDGDTLERLMAAALGAAREGLGQGEVPIGAVLARSDGSVIAHGYNRHRHTGDGTAHAEMVAFARAAAAIADGIDDLVLVSTLEPCIMCTGAAIETAVDTIVYGARAPADSGTGRVRPPLTPTLHLPRVVGDVLAGASRSLLEEWLRANPDSPQRDFVEQVLGQTSDAMTPT